MPGLRGFCGRGLPRAMRGLGPEEQVIRGVQIPGGKYREIGYRYIYMEGSKYGYV